MKKLLRMCGYLLYACGMSVLLILPTNKYDWMSDVAPSISPALIEDPSNNRFVLTVFILAIIVIIQVMLAVKSKRAKMSSIPLITIAVVVWFVKFW